MFFAKGEINMNNIYKVIWSKAKNCYVVASELARSHTKSASGSEKIGGVTRRSLLASLMALSLLCGGLGVASAEETVKVDASTAPGAAEVYTKEGVDQALSHFDTSAQVDNKIEAKIEALTTTGDVATNKDNITALQKKTTKIDYDVASDATNVNGMKVGQQVDMGGKNITNVGTINGIELGEKESGDFISQDGSIWGNMKNVDAQVGKNLVAIGENKEAITALDTKVGTVGTGEYLDPTKSVGENLGRLDAGLKKEVDDRTAADNDLSNRIGTVTDDGEYIKKSATNNVSENLKVLDGELAKTNDRTGGITRNADDTQTTIEGKVTVDKDGNVGGVKDLTVDGKLNVGEIYLENNKLESTGKKHDSATSITADGISNLAKVTEHGHTTESQFTHNEKGTFNHAKDGNTTDWKESTSNVTADGVENIAKDSKGNNNTFTQTSTDTKNILKDKDGNTSTTRQDSKGIYGYAKDKDGNKSYTKQEGNRIAESVIGQDGKQTKSEMTSTDITNTAKDGTITSDAKDIVNKATGNISNSSATMDTTVTGKATESYGELETEVKGNEKHTVKGDQTNEVDGKQINTIKNGQENIISGGQTNTITGGQINNITGDQTTTITGNKKETVTENVTEDYKKNLTTTVGGNEIHEVKGTKTETVEGKLTENFKGGQETNVTGDQTTNVSGTQTTTATDINRNASSSMVDKVDNAYGTNTETKEAGKTTTDVSIKGTGEKGQYIRGANESRDYLIKGTLMNSETKTAEATSTEITDGINKASTRQDAKNLAGSVTNGTEIGVSGIHANDDGSVSIDSAVAGGGMSSVINQKKDSIQSAVGDGTNSTVIHQDKDNVTIASSNGTVAIAGKDIVNNASESITNKAKTMDTTVTGKATESYGELETTVKGQATENFKGGLDTNVTGTENHTVDGDQNIHVTGKQTNKIDGNQENTIGGNQTTNVTGDISNTAKNITNEATDTLTDKVGDNTRVINGEGITDTVGGSTLKSIVTQKKGSIETVVTDGTSFSHSRDMPGASTKTLTGYGKMNQLLDNLNSSTKTITDGTHKTSKVQTALDITNTAADGTITNDAKNIVNNAQDTITNTAGTKITDTAGDSTVTTENGKGTTFTKTGSTAYRDGGPTDTNISGNTITTGKVTMDYADVMKDLGVGGNANIAGTTTTKTLNVTEDASVGRDLSVGGNATIAGDVTARSYKVDGKTYIDANGINANNQKITNVADGSISEGSKDAVNGGQLYGVKRDLEHQVDKVGANAAAMANLRPMEFDPSSKWNIAAAIGNYGSETAAALGAFYRPNDNVMVNLSTAFGTGENMVGGGVSVRLGKGGNKLSREETNALKAQVADLTARMDALLSVLNPNMSKDFPDVPENHWAYEAVSRLAGNDIVQGYPDGEFHGERTMTRYEMAEIIYNALSRGAEAERELVEEFKPELQAMAASEKATAEKAED